MDLKPFIPQLLPILLKGMVYNDMDKAMLGLGSHPTKPPTSKQGQSNLHFFGGGVRFQGGGLLQTLIFGSNSLSPKVGFGGGLIGSKVILQTEPKDL